MGFRVIQRRLLRVLGLLGQSQPLALQLSGVLRLELLQSIRVSGHRRLVRLGQKITLRFELSCRVIQRRLLRPIGLLGQSQPLALQLSGVL